ncbi:ATP-binding domain-containing protein [bacterium]|nr:ATP-binding domain-containing protein [bacterium]MBR2652605.1 ATP-binding domain-containing protein [bacterium]
MYTTLDDKKRNKNAVNLMTVHGAKGLEFKYVFLVSFNELVFPSRKSLEEKDGLEEERRLAYVAITRAKHELYLCTNQSYNHNLNLPSLPSRFINEINPNLLTLNQRSIIKNSNLDIG